MHKKIKENKEHQAVIELERSRDANRAIRLLTYWQKSRK